MNMHHPNRILFVFIAAAVTAYGQTAHESASQMQKQADEFLYLVTSSAPGAGPVVTGKPFCASAETDTVRVLEDGNRLTRKNVMRLCRDREGRSRREQSLETLGAAVPIAPRTIIFLYDSVQAVSYVVDPHDKVARRFAFPKRSANSENMPGGFIPEVKTEDLGSRAIEGLTCVGTRKTTRIPAGVLGNLVAIVSVSETWFSSEIESIIDSQSRDPRLGTVHYHLVQIDRRNPPLEIFKPPAGYSVEAEISPQSQK
jgi:hypothetical protein